MATQHSVADNFKIWAFPTLATIISGMIWADVREMKNDVKHLMAESNINGTKVEGIETRVDKLEQAVFISTLKKTSSEDFPKLIAFKRKDDDEAEGLDL